MDPEAVREQGGMTGFPALFISGANSDYIQAEDHQLIKTFFPGAEIVSLPGAGHWVHAEQPALLVKTIRYFLNI
jgi:pimeloyl-ACP methyl ester carboxylesterase